MIALRHDGPSPGPGTQAAAAGHMGMGRVGIHLHFSAITKNLETTYLPNVNDRASTQSTVL